jgi:hypothetical protein
LDGLDDVDFLVLGIAGFDVPYITPWFQEDFYRQVVEATNPERILFTHWDDFNLRLDQRPRWFHDPASSQRFFRDKNPDLPAQFLPIWGEIVLRNP